ncbi:MAG: DUF1893 domain-containing protein [Proteobacteria bacterium]|nr:DUF1893 domain-containing protein [Pseudomonadota bacterium]
MQPLIDILHARDCSCVIASRHEVRTFTKRGVTDLYELYMNEPAFLKDAGVADKVVGKAAAALMALGGVVQVYADVISESAAELLRRAQVEVTYGKCVPYISNRTQTGPCPLEFACNHAETACDIFSVIKNFLARRAHSH